MIRISIVIPTLNEEAMLPRLLRSLKRLKKPENAKIEEVIVVDANSNDRTVQIAKEKGCVIIEENHKNVARSRNIGANYASGDVIAFIDADCELLQHWLIEVVGQIKRKNVIAVGTSMTESIDNQTWVEKTWYELAHKSSNTQLLKEVDWLPASNLVVKNGAFEKVGGFNEELTTCEDVEIGYRLSDIGDIVKIEEDCYIHNGESKTISEFFRREAWRSRGGTRLFKEYWKKPRELFGFIFPFTMVASLIVGFIYQHYILILYYTEELEFSMANMFIPIVGPLLLLIVILRRRVRWPLMLPAAVLLCVYFAARCVGTLQPFKRPEREEDL